MQHKLGYQLPVLVVTQSGLQGGRLVAWSNYALQNSKVICHSAA